MPYFEAPYYVRLKEWRANLGIPLIVPTVSSFVLFWDPHSTSPSPSKSECLRKAEPLSFKLTPSVIRWYFRHFFTRSERLHSLALAAWPYVEKEYLLLTRLKLFVAFAQNCHISSIILSPSTHNGTSNCSQNHIG